jgi:hypothetical protein
MSTSAGVGASGEPPTSLQPTALEAVSRQFRRSRRPLNPEGWSARRLREQLPRVALHEALEILLEWRGAPGFDAAAVAWHARLAGHAPQLTLEDAGRAVVALKGLGGPSPEVGALELRALCERYGLEDVASVLEEWLTQRGSFGGL